MVLYYTFITFIFGIVLGSFYNVVGYRIPKGESLIYPPSHCTKCNHQLGASELVPIFSYIMLGGKCKNCNSRVSLFYPIFELSSGLLFALSYLVFGFSIEFAIAITFISMLLIIIISDYQTFIIPDEVLVFFSLIILIELFIQGGFSFLISSVINGLISFVIMFIVKKTGDFMFKKESMGGGDIKLMLVFGLVLGWQMSIVSIFIASFIGLPVAVFQLMISKNHKIESHDEEIPDNSIPFGPFLAVAAIIILLAKIDINCISNLFIK
ncbi:MAG: prepilin peptidase [Bacilli bacterium]|nr:prepilin peptidase [Bacilli bacterium]